MLACPPWHEALNAPTLALEGRSARAPCQLQRLVSLPYFFLGFGLGLGRGAPVRFFLGAAFLGETAIYDLLSILSGPLFFHLENLVPYSPNHQLIVDH